MHTSDKCLVDAERELQIAKDELNKAKDRFAEKSAQLHLTKRSIHAAGQSVELKFMGKFFKNMVVVPSRFGTMVELGFVKEQNVQSIKRFLEENDFYPIQHEVVGNLDKMQYTGPEGIKYFITFEKEAV